MPLKPKPAARGTRAPPWLSIVGSFFPPPSLEYVVDSVAPAVCHLALVAAPAPRAAKHGDAQNGSRHATTPDWPAAVGTAEQLPRCDEPAQLFHVGPSDSPAR